METEIKSNFDDSAMTIKRISIPIFALTLVVIIALIVTGKLPNDMMGALAVMLTGGMILGTIGDNLPIFKDWLGGGPILCIFVPAIMDYVGILPKEIGEILYNFQATNNFFAFFISALICGSIFSISRKIIVSASLRFVPAILGGTALSFLLAALGGIITGYGWKEAIFYLAIPIMGGGIGAGALPLSQVYSSAFNIDAGIILSNVMPAVVYGNVLAIFAGIALNQLGKIKPSWTGNSQIMKIEDPELIAEIEKDDKEVKSAPLTFGGLGTGFFLKVAFYMFGLAISKLLFPDVHAFVWLILLLTISKAVSLIPRRLEIDTIKWSNLWTKNVVYAVLIPIGPAYMDLETTLTVVSNPAYLIIGLLVVLGAAIGAGLAGKWAGLYPIEASIAGGLCMANMAQTGDVAVLSAAKRMPLLPFAAYSSRIGGSFILILAGILSSLISL